MQLKSFSLDSFIPLADFSRILIRFFSSLLGLTLLTAAPKGLGVDEDEAFPGNFMGL
jgi:hypothetical protein